MTRTLILIRHAKSSWDDPQLEDFDRPLNKRGRKSARAVGQWLHETGYVPEAVLCSSAARTRETFDRLKLGAEVEFRDDLYHASPETLLSALQGAKADRVAIIAHNPGIAAFAAAIVATPPPHGRFADFPTCATLVAEFDVDDWARIEPGSAKVVNFITPRELIGE
ncbi:MAG: SixA phosphatase family protein [Pseudooceanicola sp.]